MILQNLAGSDMLRYWPINACRTQNGHAVLQYAVLHERLQELAD